jgi:hypothetical protein
MAKMIQRHEMEPKVMVRIKIRPLLLSVKTFGGFVIFSLITLKKAVANMLLLTLTTSKRKFIFGATITCI